VVAAPFTSTFIFLMLFLEEAFSRNTIVEISRNIIVTLYNNYIITTFIVHNNTYAVINNNLWKNPIPRFALQNSHGTRDNFCEI
jgi:hypothetical protein